MASLQHIAPIFPTSDMGAMQAHYEALGFSVHVHAGGYGTVARDDIRIHFRLDTDEAPQERGAAYLAVDDEVDAGYDLDAGLRGTGGHVSRLPMTGSSRCSSRRGARSSRTARTTPSAPMIRAARNRVEKSRRIRQR